MFLLGGTARQKLFFGRDSMTKKLTSGQWDAFLQSFSQGILCFPDNLNLICWWDFRSWSVISRHLGKRVLTSQKRQEWITCQGLLLIQAWTKSCSYWEMLSHKLHQKPSIWFTRWFSGIQILDPTLPNVSSTLLSEINKIGTTTFLKVGLSSNLSKNLL